MQLTFEPVVNRIGDDYYIVPKNNEDNVKCVMKCSEGAAYIVGLLTENHNRDEMIAATAEHYPNLTTEEVENAVDSVRTALKAANAQIASEE